MSSVDIPDIVIGRLPLYLRALWRLTLEGAKITSSHELGKRLGISSAQIRKDLSHFGEFGKQGTGYQVDYLTEQLRQILKVDKEWKVALVGVGDLGRALAHYNGFRDRGFRITMLFDNDPAKVSTMLDGFQIYDVAQMKDLIRQHGIIAGDDRRPRGGRATGGRRARVRGSARPPQLRPYQPRRPGGRESAVH